MSSRNLNPYEPSDSFAELPNTPPQQIPQRSHVLCFVIPSLLGAFLGGNTLGYYVGTSPGDPFGTSRGAAIGGFIGLAFGLTIYVMLRARRYSRSRPEKSIAEDAPQD